MQSKTTAIIAGVVLLAALVALWLQSGISQPNIKGSPFQTLGQVLAEEAAKAIQDHGQVVAVPIDPHGQSSAIWQEQWAAFTDELKKHPSITLAAPEFTDLDRPIPLADFLQQHAQAGVIVFFVDPQSWNDLDSVPNPQTAPKIVAVGNPDLPAKTVYTRFFTSGILAALILPHPLSSYQVEPKSQREWFAKYYSLFTRQNYESLPP
jgi:hypothetical protein